MRDVNDSVPARPRQQQQRPATQLKPQLSHHALALPTRPRVAAGAPVSVPSTFAGTKSQSSGSRGIVPGAFEKSSGRLSSVPSISAGTKSSGWLGIFPGISAGTKSPGPALGRAVRTRPTAADVTRVRRISRKLGLGLAAGICRSRGPGHLRRGADATRRD